MKPLFLSVSMFVAIGVMPGLSPARGDIDPALFAQTVAVSGCCKVRRSTTSPWVRNGMSFEQCESSNADDEDAIFDSSGRTWWDRTC